MISNMMSNDGIRGVSKQIFLLLGLFFSFSPIGAMCPQAVGPITPGEGIWRVVSRIGLASNEIQSQLCALSFMGSSTTTNLECSAVFGQADIGSGGIYTIISPGTYCMSENVTFTFGAAITINSNDVTIDMQGHTLNGGNNITKGIVLGSGVENVIIKNGIIEHVTGLPANGRGISNAVGAGQLKNITISDMSFNNNSFAIGIIDSGSLIPDVNNILIENCRLYNSGPIQVIATAATVQACEVHENRNIAVTTLGGGIFLSGLPTAIGNNLLIQDCIVTSSFGINAAFIDIEYVEDAVIQNSISQGGGAAAPRGIRMFGCSNMVISNCVVQGAHNSTLDAGIEVRSPLLQATLVIENCLAQHSAGAGFKVSNGLATGYASVKFIDCVAENNVGHGFEVLCSSDWSNLIVKNCCATANGLNGFVVEIITGNLSQVVFDNCLAQDNSADGFSLLNTDTNLLKNAVFSNCVAQNNLGGTDGSTTWLGDGFGIGSASSTVGLIEGVICDNCLALGNIHDGFAFASTVTLSKIINSCAMSNTGTGINNVPSAANVILANSAFNNGADIVGVVDPTLIISRTLTGGLAGATSWVNAVS